MNDDDDETTPAGTSAPQDAPPDPGSGSSGGSAATTGADRKRFVQEIVSRFFLTAGKPGAFSGSRRLYETLRLYGYRFTRDEVEKAMRKIDVYQRYRNTYNKRPLTSHRSTLISRPYLWLYFDTLHVTQGWRFAKKHYVMAAVDGLSRRVYAKTYRSHASENALDLLRHIVALHDGKCFEVAFCDRGTEWGGGFSGFCAEHQIRLIFTTESNPNKSYFCENWFRFARRALRYYREQQGSDLSTAVQRVVESYNRTVHSTTGMTPLDAEKPENLARLQETMQRKRFDNLARHLKQFERMNFHSGVRGVGSLVKIKKPKSAFGKESQLNYSEKLFRVVKIVHSSPAISYQLADLHTNVIVPGSFTSNQLLPLD
jgi:transposase InsO family protein